MQDQPAQNAWQHRIKAAQRDLIKYCGGIDRAAMVASVSSSQMGRYNTHTQPDLMPLGVVIALEGDCGEPVVTMALAGISGRRLSDPETDRAASRNVLGAFAALSRAQADAATQMADSMADGELSPAELREADRKAADSQTKISDFRAAIASALSLGGVKAELKLVGEG